MQIDPKLTKVWKKQIIKKAKYEALLVKQEEFAWEWTQ